MENGGWSVFCLIITLPLHQRCPQSYEVIGNPPAVGVPTHFAKVVLTSRPSSPSTPDIPEISTGAFVLPNAKIPDETPFESFIVPGKLFRKFSACSDLTSASS